MILGKRKLKKKILIFQFGQGLCFYPEFGVLVCSSEKGPSQTLVWSLDRILEKRPARHWFGRFTVCRKDRVNPGSADSDFRETQCGTLVFQVLSCEKIQGQTLVQSFGLEFREGNVLNPGSACSDKEPG